MKTNPIMFPFCEFVFHSLSVDPQQIGARITISRIFNKKSHIGIILSSEFNFSYHHKGDILWVFC